MITTPLGKLLLTPTQLLLLKMIANVKIDESGFEYYEVNGKSIHVEQVPQISQGVAAITAKRFQSIIVKGFTVDYDKANSKGELKQAAIAVLTNDISAYPSWWEVPLYQKMVSHNEIDQLVIVGDLIAAEIDRLVEAKKLQAQPEEG